MRLRTGRSVPHSFANTRFNVRDLRRGIAMLYGDGGRTAARWRGAHLGTVLRLTPYTMSANIGCSLLVLWMFHEDLSTGLLVWAAGIVGLSLLAIAGWWQRRGHLLTQASRRAVRKATRHAALLAALWAVMTVVWFPDASADQQITMAALVTGMLAAGSFVLSPLPLASLAYGAIYAAASLIALWRTEDTALFGAGAMMCLYAPTVLLGAMSNWHKTMAQLAQQAQTERRERLLALLLHDFEQHADEALWETDRSGVLAHLSPRLAEMLGLAMKDIRKVRFAELLKQCCPESADSVDRAFATGPSFRDVLLAFPGGGAGRHLALKGKRLFDENGEENGWRGVLSDITDRIESERRLRYLAHTDSLTGLANRFTLREALSEQRRGSRAGALLTLDLDQFKGINDSFGHSVGDDLLKAVAGRLHECVRPDDLTARLGGDEFAIVLAETVQPTRAETLAKALIDAMRRPFQLRDRQLVVAASVGVVTWEADAEVGVEELLLRADTALYHAKSSGRARYTVYTPELGASARRRLLIEEGLRRAVERDELRLHWQPKVDIGLNRIVGAEALLRWNHPELGALSPAEFIPVAEQSGLIDGLGVWALRETCRLGAGPLAGLTVSVNVSTVQLISGRLVSQVGAALDASGMSPDKLELELTESVFTGDPEAVLVQLDAIRALGVKIALDDFGTGYSSLAYLRRFPFNTLKIDRSFVTDMPTHHDARLIVHTVMMMADAMGLHTVCEGVETEQELAAVSQAGCAEYQGYLASRPCPLEDFLVLWRDWHRRSA